MRRCWDFLDMTSRSFSAVIKELEGDLARTVSRFRLFRVAQFGHCAGYTSCGLLGHSQNKLDTSLSASAWVQPKAPHYSSDNETDVFSS